MMKVTVNGMVIECSTIQEVIALQTAFGIAPVSHNVVEPSVKNSPAVSKERKPYVATKDFKPKYKVVEYTSVAGVKLFCIARDNGWTKAEKSMMNGAIKALKGIKEIEVQGTRKDGNSFTFKAWGYATEAVAKKHLKELPALFTAAQLNGEG